MSVDPQTRFEELYRAHADGVHAYALRRTTPALADDVVADVFLIAWRRLDRVPPSAYPWLLGVARRVLANRRRSDTRATALQVRLGLEPRPEESPAGEGDGGERVLRALGSLRERDRELLMLIAWEGLSQAEAAQVLRVRRGTLSVRLHRARQRLAAALAAEDADLVTQMEVRR